MVWSGSGGSWNGWIDKEILVEEGAEQRRSIDQHAARVVVVVRGWSGRSLPEAKVVVATKSSSLYGTPDWVSFFLSMAHPGHPS